MTTAPLPEISALPLKGLHVAMATSGHPPLDDRIFFKEARTLARAGADVTLIHSNSFAAPEPKDGVRFRSYPGGGSIKKRLLTRKQLRQALESSAFDVFHCHEPDALAVALQVKKRTKAKVIFDSHEMWGAALAGRFPSIFWRPIEFVYKSFERQYLAKCDGAIGASWTIANYLTDVLGVSKVETILNVPDVSVFRAPEGTKPPPPPLIFCHDGTLTFDRGLKVIAESIRFAAREADVKLRIVGDVFKAEKDWLEDYISRHSLDGVIERTGWLEYSRVGAAIAPCHVGLIALQKTPNNIVTSSNKVFNYLLYGLPFIGPEFRYSKQRLVREDHCGLLADSTSPQSYGNAMLRLAQTPDLLESLSRHARIASETKYRWSHMEPLLLRLYLDIV